MWEADKIIFQGNEYVKAYQGNELVWEKQQQGETKGIKFTALEPTTIGISALGDVAVLPIYAVSSSGAIRTKDLINNPISLVEGEELYVYAITDGVTSLNTNTSSYYTFKSSGKYNVGGSIKEFCGIRGDYGFKGLFNGTPVVNARDLDISYDLLNPHMYAYMFSNCVHLEETPIFPKKSMIVLGRSNYCCQYMFRGCTSLVVAHDLLSNDGSNYASDYCYQHMFEGCTSLVVAPKLKVISIGSSVYNSMFKGCTSLVEAPALEFTSVSTSGCTSMFEGCTSLVEAPELPATSIAKGCYAKMFKGCTSLTKAPSILPAKSLNSSNTNPYTQMFEDCPNLIEAPELPATTLYSKCYNYMFNCGSPCKLNWVKALFTTTPSTSFTSSWLTGTASSGVFVANINATWTDTITRGGHTVPVNWSIIYFDSSDNKYYTTKTKEVECDKYGNPLESDEDTTEKTTYTLDLAQYAQENGVSMDFGFIFLDGGGTVDMSEVMYSGGKGRVARFSAVTFEDVTDFYSKIEIFGDSLESVECEETMIAEQDPSHLVLDFEYNETDSLTFTLSSVPQPWSIDKIIFTSK